MVKISCDDECQIMTENIEDAVKALSKNVREYIDESTVDLTLDVISECCEMLKVIESEHPEYRRIFKDDFRRFSRLMGDL